MRLTVALLLTLLTSCAHNRGPASVNNELKVASDSMAMGNITANAVKTSKPNEVCFDINLRMKGVEQSEAQASNWTIAWIDKESKYHLLSLNQRDPASVPKGGTKVLPYGAYEEWSNTFRTCAPQANADDVQSLVLTPKTLSYKESEGMNLEWK